MQMDCFSSNFLFKPLFNQVKPNEIQNLFFEDDFETKRDGDIADLI